MTMQTTSSDIVVIGHGISALTAAKAASKGGAHTVTMVTCNDFLGAVATARARLCQRCRASGDLAAPCMLRLRSPSTRLSSFAPVDRTCS